MPLWVDIVVKLTPALVTLVLGLVASCIGYLQYKTNRDKFRLDLFNKRLEAYEKLEEFFTSVLREGTVRDGALGILAEARYKSRFLFDQGNEKFFDNLWKQAVDVHFLYAKMYGPSALPVGPDRTEVCERESALVREIHNLAKDAPQQYARYLRFD